MIPGRGSIQLSGSESGHLRKGIETLRVSTLGAFQRPEGGQKAAISVRGLKLMSEALSEALESEEVVRKRPSP